MALHTSRGPTHHGQLSTPAESASIACASAAFLSCWTAPRCPFKLDWIPRRLGQDVPLDARARTVRRFPGCLHNPTKGLPAREKMRRGAIAKFNFCMVGRTTP
eukprot:scaffold148440_cov32-Tisochrysis_lutea.AAC.3